MNDKIDPNRKKKNKRRKRDRQRREGEEDFDEEAKMANDDDRSHLQEEDEATKKLEVSTAIEKILNSLRNVQWSLEETS